MTRMLLAQVANAEFANPVWHVVDTQTGVTEYTFLAPFDVADCQHVVWRPSRSEVAVGTESELVVFDVSPPADE